MADDDDVSPIVIDIGTGWCKVGYGGDDAPRGVFPTIVGRPEQGSDRGLKSSYVGNDAQSLREVLAISSPFVRGEIQNWDSMEMILSHSYKNVLRDIPKEHPVLVSELPLTSKASRERMMQLLFEEFNVPAIAIKDQSVLALFGSGRHSGIVVDVGECSASVVPIVQGEPLQGAVWRADFGGRDLTTYLSNLLQESGHAIQPTSDLVREIKENVGCVAQSNEVLSAPGDLDASLQRTHNLKDGTALHLKREHLQCPEALYQPSLCGLEVPGIHEAAYASALKCPEDLRSTLLQNVVLAGGSTLFAGFPERFEKEISDWLPNHSVRVASLPNRRHLAWLGGSILVSLNTDPELWTLREEYDEPVRHRPHRRKLF